MKLGERIAKNQQFIQNVQITGGLNIVQVAYPKEWVVIPDSKGNISITKDENGMVYYYSKMDVSTLEDILDHVEYTVSENQEIELKKQMLVDRIEELKRLFDNNNMEKLSKLKFVFDEPLKVNGKTQKKTKGKQKKTVTPEIQEQQPIMEEEIEEGGILL